MSLHVNELDKLPVGRHRDGGHLCLLVRESTRTVDGKPVLLRAWTFCYNNPRTKRPVEMGLGGYPVVSLDMARQHAADQRAILATGIDPLERRRALLKSSLYREI